MKKFLVFLICSLSIFCTFGCKQKEDLSKISKELTSYSISINLDTEKKHGSASQKVDYINKSNSFLKNIKFHLYPQFFKEGGTEYIISNTKLNNTFQNGINFANFNIDRVQINNTDRPIVYENEFDSILSVELMSSLMPGERVEIEMDYSFRLPNCNHRYGYGSNTINLGNFYPIACVYENNQFNTNPYNANGDPFYSNIANYCVDITLNQQYIVAATGNKTSEITHENNKKISFKANAVRDFALVASKKFKIEQEKLNDINVEYFYFNDNNPSKTLSAGIDSIKTFSSMFGKYPYQNFAIVQTDFVHGGMEYPNLVMISSSIENEDDYLNVVIHETAHQWWYNIVGNDEFTYPWLDEALTEFSTVLFYNKNKSYNFTHEQMIESAKENYSLFISVYEDVLGTIDTSMRSVDKYETEPEYTYCTYVKGVLMFDCLYNLIGEKTFIKSLQTYYENNKFTNSTPACLIESFEQIYKKDLHNFFSSWINGKVVIR